MHDDPVDWVRFPTPSFLSSSPLPSVKMMMNTGFDSDGELTELSDAGTPGTPGQPPTPGGHRSPSPLAPAAVEVALTSTQRKSSSRNGKTDETPSRRASLRIDTAKSAGSSAVVGKWARRVCACACMRGLTDHSCSFLTTRNAARQTSITAQARVNRSTFNAPRTTNARFSASTTYKGRRTSNARRSECKGSRTRCCRKCTQKVIRQAA